MSVLAEFQVGQVLWSIFWFFLFFLWIWLVISIFADIIRSDDLSGWGKALWAIAIIILPFLGIFLYLIVRGGQMGERAAANAQQSEEAFQSYIRQTAGSSSPSDQLASLADLHANGKIDDDEYAKAKARVLDS
ncbi:MAG: SHOCT domain-containing protein [Acidimicrobiales bacterium]